MGQSIFRQFFYSRLMRQLDYCMFLKSINQSWACDNFRRQRVVSVVKWSIFRSHTGHYSFGRAWGGRGLAVERGGGGSALVGGEGIGSHAATVGSMADKAPKFDATPSSVCFFKTCSFHFQWSTLYIVLQVKHDIWPWQVCTERTMLG